jgi:hypothetical protein
MRRTKSFGIALARLLGVAAGEPLAPAPARHRQASRTSLHAICVSAYRMHHAGSSGACVQCGKSAPCPARGFAKTVIEAHADDPRRYDDFDSGNVRCVAGAAVGQRKGRSD